MIERSRLVGVDQGIDGDTSRDESWNWNWEE
jgi:hypothetical protein